MHQAGRRAPAGQQDLQGAALHALVRHQARQQRTAGARQGRVQQGARVVHHQARLVMVLDPLALGPAQAPALLVGRIAQAQRGQRGQVVGCRGRRCVDQQLGGRHQQMLAQGQRPHHLVLRQPSARRAHAQGQVHAVVPHIDVAVAGLHLQLHLRPAVEVVGQHRPHRAVQQRRRAGQAHGAARRAADLVGQGLRGGGFIEHGAGVAQHLLADLGDGKAARAALDQARAQLRLQRGQATTQARLGRAAGALGGGKAAVLGHQGKQGQVIEIGRG